RTACGCAFSSCSKIAGDFVAHPLFSPSPDCCEIPHAIRVLSAPRRQFPFAAILRVFRRDRQVHSDLRLLTGGLHGGGGETRRRSGRGRAPKAFARSRYSYRCPRTIFLDDGRARDQHSEPSRGEKGRKRQRSTWPRFTELSVQWS